MVSIKNRGNSFVQEFNGLLLGATNKLLIVADPCLASRVDRVARPSYPSRIKRKRLICSGCILKQYSQRSSCTINQYNNY